MKEEIKKEILQFRDKVKNYEMLLENSRNEYVPQIERNNEKIDQSRSELNIQYGKIGQYIEQLGNCKKSVYQVAFSGDVFYYLREIFDCLDNVLQDLDYIQGRLDKITDKELENILKSKEKTHKRTIDDFWKWAHPLWYLWRLVNFIWYYIRHYKKISIGSVVAILGFLAIDYSMAWRNMQLLARFFSNLFK